MVAKSPQQKAIEKQMKEERRLAQEAARRDRAKAVVDAASYIGSFRIMNAEAEAVLRSALENLEDTSKYNVSVNRDDFTSNIYDNFPLVCEELQQYGMITAYMLPGSFARLTLSEAGKTYFDEKEKAEKGKQEMMEEKKNPMLLISHSTADKNMLRH